MVPTEDSGPDKTYVYECKYLLHYGDHNYAYSPEKAYTEYRNLLKSDANAGMSEEQLLNYAYRGCDLHYRPPADK